MAAAKLSVDRWVEEDPSSWQLFWHWQLPLVLWAVTAPAWVPLWLVGEGIAWAVRQVRHRIHTDRGAV